jgi:hypothetical protein
LINIDINFFIKIDKHSFKILSLNSGNMNRENMFLLLENLQYIEFIYLLYFNHIISNMHPRYGNGFLL